MFLLVKSDTVYRRWAPENSVSSRPVGRGQILFPAAGNSGQGVKVPKKKEDRKVKAIIGFHMAKEGYQSARS